MTPAREAIYLPLLCLTVVLFGGIRMGAPAVLLPPTPFMLVLGFMLMGVLVQSGALAPERVLSESRSALENLNGFVILVTLFLACAQTFAMLTPASGLPRPIFSMYFLVLMLNAFATRLDRVRVLRSLGVTFGMAFVLNFVVLNALSDPQGGWMTRLFQVMLEGITLGALTQPVHHPATGYIAFFTLVLFLVVLSVLPARRSLSARRSELLPASDEDRPRLQQHT